MSKYQLQRELPFAPLIPRDPQYNPSVVFAYGSPIRRKINHEETKNMKKEKNEYSVNYVFGYLFKSERKIGTVPRA